MASYDTFKNMYLEDLGDYRLMTNLSQVDFAAACNLPLSLIQRIEQGRKDIFSLSLSEFNSILHCLESYDRFLARKFLDTFIRSYKCSFEIITD